MAYTTVPGSFRDPSGFLYSVDGELYRQVNPQYRLQYERLSASGLLSELFTDRLLVEHEEASIALAATPEAYRVLKPAPIPFVSYPFEWSFGQLKAAALLTLTILKRALNRNMVLKDASAYNVQFLGAHPLFIDTLSFDIYEEGSPWVAYRQFCQHFLAPLALMKYVDSRLSQLYQTNIDGVPLDLTNAMLPMRAKLRPSIAAHIVLHARAQRRYADAGNPDIGHTLAKPRVSRLGLQGIILNLEKAVAKLEWRIPDTEWADYYSDTNYQDEAMSSKTKLVGEFLSAIGHQPLIIDMGSNTGEFSAIAAQYADYVVSMDADPVAVETHFRNLSVMERDDILPLRVDLTVPSPGIGWANEERLALRDRFSNATVLALALIHHLAITNNVPLSRIADFLSRYANDLVIEFVPKSDSQVARLLATREDIFPHYTRALFERDFSEWFEIRRSEQIVGSERTLYLMKHRRCSVRAVAPDPVN